VSTSIPPQTWLEGTVATPQQWRDWFLSASPEAQLEIAAQTEEATQRGFQCFVHDHETAIKYLDEQNEKLMAAVTRASDALVAWNLAAFDRIKSQG
jgi:hypothetical protein